jgi:hypothetical protein
LALLLAAVGCSTGPRGYPPPAQTGEIEAWALDPPFAEMGAADAGQSIVRDISSTIEGGTWRWTFARPELRFILNCTERQTLAADFFVADATFAQTGPVTVHFEVNGRLLTSVRCAHPASRHVEEPVPESWLSTKSYTRITIWADKLFVSEEDGARLGIALLRAGFIESCGKPSSF